MRKCNACEPAVRAVERLMLAVANKRLQPDTEEAINRLLDEAGIEDSDQEVECALIFTSDDQTYLLHSRKGPAEKTQKETHFDDKCTGPTNSHVQEVVPLAFTKQSKSGCMYIAGEWVCW